MGYGRMDAAYRRLAGLIGVALLFSQELPSQRGGFGFLYRPWARRLSVQDFIYRVEINRFAPSIE